MKVYSIFDDFDKDAIEKLVEGKVEIEIHPYRVPRPNEIQMQAIIEEYDCVIIGTSQIINEVMFCNVTTPKLIATASVGVDHISVPKEKLDLITIINTPKANAKSVAEYTIGMALNCCKRLNEGLGLYKAGKDNKSLIRKPEDLCEKMIGVIGAGNVSQQVMELASIMGMKVCFWTKHPEKHLDLIEKGFAYIDLSQLLEKADVISVNLPNNDNTVKFVNDDMVAKMKRECIFISVSRLVTIDMEALLKKALDNPAFYVCVDIDIDRMVIDKLGENPNVFITPHIAGGTVETRKRMFRELAEQIVEWSKNETRSNLV